MLNARQRYSNYCAVDVSSTKSKQLFYSQTHKCSLYQSTKNIPVSDNFTKTSKQKQKICPLRSLSSPQFSSAPFLRLLLSRSTPKNPTRQQTRLLSPRMTQHQQLLGLTPVRIILFPTTSRTIPMKPFLVKMVLCLIQEAA